MSTYHHPIPRIGRNTRDTQGIVGFVFVPRKGPFLFFTRAIGLHGHDVIMKGKGCKGTRVGGKGGIDGFAIQIAFLCLFDGNQESDKGNGQGNLQELRVLQKKQRMRLCIVEKRLLFLSFCECELNARQNVALTVPSQLRLR